MPINAQTSYLTRLIHSPILITTNSQSKFIIPHSRLENSYIQVRRERDNLVRLNRDSVDSKTGPHEEIQKMRSEMELKRKTFEAQFIEYVSIHGP